MVALLVAWPAFGGGGGQGAATTAASAAERAALLATGQRIVRPAGERAAAAPIRLQTASFGDGSVFDISAERGNVVILYFMAAWCFTCIPEAQALAQIHETYADQGVRVLVLDVDVTENEDNLAGFREQAGNGEHLWAMDVDDEVARSYNVRLLDTTIFIDREGRIAYMDGSPTSYEVLAAIIEALLL
jgi:thiol-disulfide isomerase/thioredoxin